MNKYKKMKIAVWLLSISLLIVTGILIYQNVFSCDPSTDIKCLSIMMEKMSWQ